MQLAFQSDKASLMKKWKKVHKCTTSLPAVYHPDYTISAFVALFLLQKKEGTFNEKTLESLMDNLAI